MKSRRHGKEGASAKAGGPSGPVPPKPETRAPSVTERLSEEELASVERIERDAAERVAKRSRKLESSIALTLVGLSILAIIGSRSIVVSQDTAGFEPRTWPTIISALALALSILLAVVVYTRPPFERDDLEITTRPGWYRFGATVLLSALFILAWDLSENFVVPCAVMLVVLVWIYDGRGWKALLAFPVLLTAFVFVLFDTVLRIPL